MKNLKNESLYSCRVHTCITKEKLVELKKLVANSYSKSMSEFLRSLIDNRKITLTYYDETMDKVIWELSGIRKELQMMSINMNQTTNKLLLEQNSEKAFMYAKEIAEQYQRLEPKLQPIFEIMTKIANIWLPK